MRLELPTQVAFTGGLNTRQSVFVGADEAVIARNVDISTNGVVKRRGTARLLTTGAGQIVASHFFYSNTGVKFCIVLQDTALQIYHVNTAGGINILRQVLNVFNTVPLDVNFVTLPGEYASVLILSRNQQPVQLTCYDFTSNFIVGTEARFFDYAVWTAVDAATKFNNTYRFVNGVQTSAVLSTVSNYVTFTSPLINAATFQTASLVAFTVNAWTEADAWRGDNFHDITPRLHAVNADSTVEIPSTIREEPVSYNPRNVAGFASLNAPYLMMRASSVPIGITAPFYFDVLPYAPVNGKTLPIALSQTLNYTKYAFSNGTYVNTNQRAPYRTVSLADIGQGSTHITFGNSRSYLRYTLNSSDSLSASIATVPNHGYETGDVVFVPVARGNTLDTTSSVIDFRYVQKLDANRFRLYFDEGLTNPDTSALGAQTTWSAQGSMGAQGTNQQIGFPVNIPTGTAIRYVGTTLNNIGIPNGTYYVRALGLVAPGQWNYNLCFDAALRFNVQTMTVAYVGNGGTFTVPLDFQVERFIQDTVYFSRVRLVPFNNYLGAPPADIGIIRTNAFGTNFTDFNTNTGLNGRTTSYSMFFNVLDFQGTPLAAAEATVRARCYYVHTNAVNSGNDWQIIYNKRRTWIGSVFTANALPQNNKIESSTWAQIDGMLVPMAGYGRFANFESGVFPNIGTVYNGRLVLTGMPDKANTLLFSGVLDSAGLGINYSYMQVYVGQDTSNASNPFDLVIDDSENARITAVHTWQDQLFVFTSDRVYQVNATAPTSRQYKLLAGNGAINSYCVCNSDRMLYFASRNGVYALPLLDSGQYRTGDVSLKVYDVLVKSLAGSKPFLLYNNDDAVVTLVTRDEWFRYNTRYDNWTVYDTVLGFGSSYAMVLEKWLAVVCTNKLGTVLLREGGLSYTDFTSNNVSTTTATYMAASQSVPVVTRQRFYKCPWRMSTVTQRPDVAVWLGTTQLNYGTQFRKVNDYLIELLDASITSGTLTFAPLGDGGDYYGAIITLNGWQTPLALNPLVVGNLTFVYTTLLQGTTQGNQLALAGSPIGGTLVNTIEVGYMYISEFQSGALGAELLDVYKRCESVSVLLSDPGVRSLADAAVPQYVLTDFRSVWAGAALSVKVVADRERSEDTYAELTVSTYADDFVLYRDRVNLLGYMFSLHLVSQNGFTFNIIAWGTDVKALQGTGQVSGGK